MFGTVGHTWCGRKKNEVRDSDEVIYDLATHVKDVMLKSVVLIGGWTEKRRKKRAS